MDKKDSVPSFIEKVGCTYIFWWDHHSACPLNASHLITQDSCMVTDGQSGHTFDLRPLKSVNMTTVDASGREYHLSICKTLQGNDKCQNSAACTKSKDGTYANIGLPNDRLTFEGYEPVLHYDNGLFHTSIHFICAPIKSANAGKLVMLNQIKNHFYFDYFTTLACLHTVHCASADGKSDHVLSYDLSGLKNYEEDINIVDPGNSKTILSVCKPLVNQDHMDCPKGSAICKTIFDSNKKVEVTILKNRSNPIQD